MQDDPDGSLPIIYRRRAQELLDLSETLSAPARDELIKVALMWRRMAQKAEDELLKMMEGPPKE